MKFGIPSGVEAELSIRTAVETCWRAACRSPSRIVRQVEVTYGGQRCALELSGLGTRPALLADVLQRLPADPLRGIIKRRRTGAGEASLVTNGCIACGGALATATRPRSDPGQRHRLGPLRVSAAWHALLESQGKFGWHILPLGTQARLADAPGTSSDVAPLPPNG